MNTPKYIIIHHSLTKDSVSVSWGAIRKYHMGLLPGSYVEHPMINIGYHYGIELVDDQYEVLLGRFEDEHGAHCTQQNMNMQSLGICCVGNFDIEQPHIEQWKTCLLLTKYLQQRYNIVTANVLGHGELALYKSCPGKNWDMDLFRDQCK